MVRKRKRKTSGQKFIIDEKGKMRMPKLVGRKATVTEITTLYKGKYIVSSEHL